MSHELPPPDEQQPTQPELHQPLEFSGTSALNVNGELLTPSHGIEIFRRALSEGHDYINRAIEHEYEKTKRLFPDHKEILPPPIIVMLLGSRDKDVLTEEGYYAGSNPYNDREGIDGQFKPFWDAVLESGFTPDVWATGTRSGRTVYLRARRSDVRPSGVTYDPE